MWYVCRIVSVGVIFCLWLIVCCICGLKFWMFRFVWLKFSLVSMVMFGGVMKCGFSLIEKL